MNALDEDAPSPVGSRRGQSKLLVWMEFCPASLERQWALIVGTFHFWLGSPWLKKPSSCCCTNSMLGVSQIWRPQVDKSDANAICIMFCVLCMWKATQTIPHPSLLIIEQWAIINDQKHWSFRSASRSGCGTVSHHRGLKDFEFQTGNSLITLQKWS